MRERFFECAVAFLIYIYLGFFSDSLTTADYEALTNRGWTRCGRLLYKPIHPLSCCPYYTIRLKIHEFKPSKSQQKTMKRMENFLLYGSPSNKKVSKQNDSTNTKPKSKSNVNEKEKHTLYHEREIEIDIIHAQETKIATEIETAIKRAQQAIELPLLPSSNSLKITVHHQIEYTSKSSKKQNKNDAQSKMTNRSPETQSDCVVVWYSSAVAISFATLLYDAQSESSSKTENNSNNNPNSNSRSNNNFNNLAAENKKRMKERKKQEIEKKSMEIASIIIKYFDRTKVNDIHIVSPGFLRFRVIHTLPKSTPSLNKKDIEKETTLSIPQPHSSSQDKDKAHILQVSLNLSNLTLNSLLQLQID
jgi:hypothetical protein